MRLRCGSPYTLVSLYLALTPFPPRGIPTFPDPESRPRNSLKSPHNSREWLPGRRGVAAVWRWRSTDAQDLAHGRSSSGRDLPRGLRAPP